MNFCIINPDINLGSRMNGKLFFCFH